MIAAPTIQELLEVASTAIRGDGDKNADLIRGSDYDSLIGPCAVIWSRQSQRDTDLFDAVNFHTATGDDLTDLALKRFGKVRVMDTRGAGTATFTRSSSGVSETIWAGTRLMVVGSNPKVYRVKTDTAVGSALTSISVPIEAIEIGPGSALTITDPGGKQVSINDLLTSAWKVTALTCADGTLFEEADAFRTRIRTERATDRVGQTAAIIAACESAGAVHVALFRSDYAGDEYDYGLNVCYVGNSGYTGTPELVKACTLALRSKRVLGDHIQVLPMAMSSLDVSANVYLIDTPGKFDLSRLEAVHTAAITQYLNGGSGNFSYSMSGILGAIIRHTPEVHRVELVTPTVDATIVTGDMKNFPAVLQRHVLSSISLQYLA